MILLSSYVDYVINFIQRKGVLERLKPIQLPLRYQDILDNRHNFVAYIEIYKAIFSTSLVCT